MSDHRGADAGEGHLTQRQPARVADDGDDREPDDGEAPHLVEAEHVGFADGGGQEDGDDDRADTEETGAVPRGSEGQLAAPELPMAPQSRLRQDEERNEQDDRRYRVL